MGRGGRDVGEPLQSCLGRLVHARAGGRHDRRGGRPRGGHLAPSRSRHRRRDRSGLSASKNRGGLGPADRLTPPLPVLYRRSRRSDVRETGGIMSETVATMVQEANAGIQNLTPSEVSAEAEAGALLIDVREEDERRNNGVIPGPVPAPRGMLEFYADPASPYYRPEFRTDRRIVL